MKVLHVFKTYLPDSFTGIERVIHTLSETLADDGLESTVFFLSPDPHPDPYPVDRHRAVSARQHLYLASTGIGFSAVRSFRRQVEASDIVHYHFPWPMMDVLHLAGRVRKPSVCTYHSDIIKQKATARLYGPLMHRFLGSMDRIVATSPNYAQTSPVLERYREKVSVIPIGLPESAVPHPDSARVAHWRERLGTDFFLFLGALRYYKGLPFLLEAAKRTDLPVVLAGAGEMPEGDVPANVTLVGAVSEADKAALLALARAFVFPSHLRSEAFGIALLEAAFAGKPLISCEIGTGTSYINRDGETGIVIPPRDAGALAGAMGTLAGDPQMRSRMGNAAQTRARTHFTARAMGTQYLTLYQSMLENRRSAL